MLETVWSAPVTAGRVVGAVTGHHASEARRVGAWMHAAGGAGCGRWQGVYLTLALRSGMGMAHA